MLPQLSISQTPLEDGQFGPVPTVLVLERVHCMAVIDQIFELPLSWLRVMSRCLNAEHLGSVMKKYTLLQALGMLSLAQWVETAHPSTDQFSHLTGRYELLQPYNLYSKQ